MIILLKRFSHLIKKKLFQSMVLIAGATFSCSLLFAVESQTAAFAQRKIAYEISETAFLSQQNFAYIGFTLSGSEDSGDYYTIFQDSRTLNWKNFNRSGYTVKSAFVANTDNYFSTNYEYTIGNEILNSLIGSSSLSLLASPLNLISNYTHEIWKLKMIFNEKNLAIGEGCDNFCFIPESWAISILKAEGKENPDISDIHNLIGQSIIIDFKNKITGDSESQNWSIANIFYEDQTFNTLFYQYGWFLPCYTANLPTYEYPSVVIQFGISVYTNKYYLEEMAASFGERILESFLVSNSTQENVIIDFQKLPYNLRNFENLGINIMYFYILCVLIFLILMFLEFLLVKKAEQISPISRLITSSLGYLLAKLVLLIFFGSFITNTISSSSIAFTIIEISLLIINVIFIKTKFYKKRCYGFKKQTYRV